MDHNACLRRTAILTRILPPPVLRTESPASWIDRGSAGRRGECLDCMQTCEYHFRPSSAAARRGMADADRDVQGRDVIVLDRAPACASTGSHANKTIMEIHL
jgi:hypothetical protein